MRKIIVAPLNWGLGHASRCVPIIKSLIANKYQPIIASDGDALSFLLKEFPTLEWIELPSYTIRYGKNLKIRLFFQIPKVLKAISEERNIIEQYVGQHTDVVGVISDNRFGARSTKVPSVYITHQINVLSGFWTLLTSTVHQRIIKHFNECWIPDDEGSPLSGKLSISKRKLPKKYIGVLSRFAFEKKEYLYDLAVILSGPEPQRTQLENKLLRKLEHYQGRAVFIRGRVESSQKRSSKKKTTTYNYVLSEELQEILNSAEVVVSRSGYSSIMDYAVTNKKAILIPTQGQTEQEYLAQYLTAKEEVISVKEDAFHLSCIEEAKKLKGLRVEKKQLDKELFRLFERE